MAQCTKKAANAQTNLEKADRNTNRERERWRGEEEIHRKCMKMQAQYLHTTNINCPMARHDFRSTLGVA